MADEIRATATGGMDVDTTVPGSVRTVTTPNDPHAARAQIEATRARMSETIDEIEGALLRKKEQIQDRLDLFAPVRERPIQTLGVIFGAGLLLGLLTGGEDEDEDHEEWTYDAWERADTWEDRARRLLRIARDQESELELLRSRYDGHAPDGAGELEGDEDDSMFQRLGATATNQISGLVANAIHRMLRG